MIVRALLQASKFADNDWKSYSIEVARTASLEDITIGDRAYLAYRLSFILRHQGRPNEAGFIIKEILETSPPGSEPGPLLNAIYGLLLSSLSWTYVAQVRFEKAVAVSLSWTAGTSLYESRAEQKLTIVRGIANKHLGKLDNAIYDLNAVLDVSVATRARLYVLANLSDAYCENQQFQVAYDMLKSTAEMQLASVQDTYHRTLLISFSEVCSYLGRYDESNAILVRLKDHFELSPCTERNDQQRHIRTFVLLAQNKHRQASNLDDWIDTQRSWRKLIHLTTEYQVLLTSGWDYATMCLSLYHALKMALQEDEGEAWLHKANDIFLSGVEDHFWMRSLPINWVSNILRQNLGISDELRSRIMICTRLVLKT
jgi:tetratricopeptide (TPR) repeat protein